MESRRLIKFGTNSHVISLPKHWLETHKLKKGDQLYLDEKPDSIILFATLRETAERTARIACDAPDLGRLRTEVASYYKAGYTTFLIEGRELPGVVDDLKEFIHNLAGLELVEQTRNKMVVKDLIDIKQIAPFTLINRIDVMIRSMFQDVIDGVPSDVLRSRDKDVNRLQLLATRTMRSLIENPALSNALGVDTVSAYALERIAWALERIGDYLKRADGDIIRSAPEVQQQLRKLITRIYELYLSSMKAYNWLDRELAITIHQEVLDWLENFTKHVHAATQKDELLALENAKNILRDLRMVQRATIEMSLRGKGQPST